MGISHVYARHLPVTVSVPSQCGSTGSTVSTSVKLGSTAASIFSSRRRKGADTGDEGSITFRGQPSGEVMPSLARSSIVIHSGPWLTVPARAKTAEPP